MRILAVGDVVGDAGLDTVSAVLRKVKHDNQIDFTVVNGENAAGTGIKPDQAEEIMDAGADVITLGNHSFQKKKIFPYLEDNRHILRPANFAPQSPGIGAAVYDAPGGKRVLVMNLIGRCEMKMGPDNPFLCADALLKRFEGQYDVALCDFHAGATSEKLAMGYYLDGRCAAVWGTHTHVPTADERVNPKGTGYITDLGMTGPVVSVLGVEPAQSIAMFRGDMTEPFRTAPGACALMGAVFDVDGQGACTQVYRIKEMYHNLRK